MSANPDETPDFAQVADVVAPDKVTPKKAATPPPKRAPKSREEIKAELAAEFEARETPDETDLERLKAEIRAELEAEYQERLKQVATPKADASYEGLTETPYVHIEPGPGQVLIHMVDDGLTFGQKVYLRGEELAVDPEENPWVNYSRTEQIRRFEKQLYAKGPWPYGGYDLTDPELTAEDKKRLIQATTTSESFG